MIRQLYSLYSILHMQIIVPSTYKIMIKAQLFGDRQFFIFFLFIILLLLYKNVSFLLHNYELSYGSIVWKSSIFYFFDHLIEGMLQIVRSPDCLVCQNSVLEM